MRVGTSRRARRDARQPPVRAATTSSHVARGMDSIRTATRPREGWFREENFQNIGKAMARRNGRNVRVLVSRGFRPRLADRVAGLAVSRHLEWNPGVVRLGSPQIGLIVIRCIV